MKFKEFCDALYSFAPIELSDELRKIDGAYDNSGVIFGIEKDIKTAVFCLDLTGKSAEYAVKTGADAIVTHHPAIYRPVKNVTYDSPLAVCVKNGVGVVSMHLNLDAAKLGIDYYLAEGLGGKVKDIYQKIGRNTGYGRLSEIEGAKAAEILGLYKKNFETDKVYLYGDDGKEIRKIASFCGAARP